MYKNHLKVEMRGYHPLMALIGNYIKRKGGVFVQDGTADLFIVGRGFEVDPGDTPVLVLSSSDVFNGTKLKKKVPESLSPSIFSAAPFAERALAYLTAENYYLTNANNVLVMRTFGVWGPNSPKSVLTKMINSALNGDVFYRYHFDRKLISFLHENDFINYFEILVGNLLNKEVTGIFNVGSDIPISLKELSTHIWSSAGFSTDNPVDEPGSPLEWRPMCLVPEMSKTKAITKYRPKISLKTELSAVIKNSTHMYT